MTGAPVGVLVMAHGTPAGPDELEAFYTAIRRGRPPSPEQLDELRSRYEAIGGLSPLLERTQAQVDGLRRCLDASAPGMFRVFYGAKYLRPSIEDAVAGISAAGIRRAVSIVLTPHAASLGSGQYHERARVAAGAAEPAIELLPVPCWHLAPGLADLLAARLDAALASLDARARRDPVVVFTAHSLPARVVDEGDPYPTQVLESARTTMDAWARHAGEVGTGSTASAGTGGTGATGSTGGTLPAVPRWEVAWQSAGRTPDPWLGPDILERITALASGDATAVVVCPVGFVSDHLEILFDLDVEAAKRAAGVGLPFARTASLNDDPAFLSVLAEVVVRAARQGSGLR